MTTCLLLVFCFCTYIYAQEQQQQTQNMPAGQMPTNYAYNMPYNGGGGSYNNNPASFANVNTNFANGKATGTNAVAVADTGATTAKQNMDYSAAIHNTADSALSTCAAFVCVEFVDSLAFGTNTLNTYSGQSNQAYANQGSSSAANQVAQATYNYPQVFTAYSVYGGLPAGGAAGAAFPFYGASGYSNQNQFAYGNSASNQATTQSNNYFNENFARTATGKKCSKYVCTHSVDSATTNQVGPNYNINNGYTSSATQVGPNFLSTYGLQNNAGSVNVATTPFG